MKNILKLSVAACILVACGGKDVAHDATGSFEADEIIVSAEVTGVIRQFDVREGAEVRAGQPLGWIDSTQLYLKKKQLLSQIDAILSRRPHIATQLAAYRVQLETAQRELLRVENLFKSEAATQKQVDDARAQVSVIERQMEAHRSSLDISSQGLVSETLPLYAQIEQIDDQMRRSRIVNPVDGVVLNKYSELHELVLTGKPLYKVAPLKELDLRAYITGSQLATIKLNQEVSVMVDDGSAGYREYPGTITWISDKAEFTPKTIQTREERADLVYAVKVRVVNDGLLKIGMYGEVKL
jgi:HlyD family secretion protein